ncbi:hypothetical protein K438DRAFT_1772627 [Mycena galopus ATCC 62051]|nr:hypothetical protein K438DRAFT_1772627 [Mycena galopus ATCC 62051]
MSNRIERTETNARLSTYLAVYRIRISLETRTICFFGHLPSRNRNSSSNLSPSTFSHSSSTAGLAGRQRQALRINHASASTSPRSNPSSLPVGLSVSPPEAAISSSPPESDLPSTGTSPASVPAEGIRIRRVLDLDESERASPSMYPTPLPDEVEEVAPMEGEADLLPVLKREEMAGVFEVADLEAPLVESALGQMEEEEAPTARAEEPLVDVGGPPAAGGGGRTPSRREPRKAQERDEPPRRPKEMSTAQPPQRTERRVDAAVADTRLEIRPRLRFTAQDPPMRTHPLKDTAPTRARTSARGGGKHRERVCAYACYLLAPIFERGPTILILTPTPKRKCGGAEGGTRAQRAATLRVGHGGATERGASYAREGARRGRRGGDDSGGQALARIGSGGEGSKGGRFERTGDLVWVPLVQGPG